MSFHGICWFFTCKSRQIKLTFMLNYKLQSYVFSTITLFLKSKKVSNFLYGIQLNIPVIHNIGQNNFILIVSIFMSSFLMKNKYSLWCAWLSYAYNPFHNKSSPTPSPNPWKGSAPPKIEYKKNVVKNVKS